MSRLFLYKINVQVKVCSAIGLAKEERLTQKMMVVGICDHLGMGDLGDEKV